MIENNMPLKERKKILNHLQEKTTTFTQLHVLKDAIEAHEKLDKIERIIENEKDISALCYYDKIREVLNG